MFPPTLALALDASTLPCPADGELLAWMKTRGLIRLPCEPLVAPTPPTFVSSLAPLASPSASPSASGASDGEPKPPPPVELVPHLLDYAEGVALERTEAIMLCVLLALRTEVTALLTHTLGGPARRFVFGRRRVGMAPPPTPICTDDRIFMELALLDAQLALLPPSVSVLSDYVGARMPPWLHVELPAVSTWIALADRLHTRYADHAPLREAYVAGKRTWAAAFGSLASASGEAE